MEIFFTYCSKQIKDEIKPNTYVVSEGANTMDIGRVSPQQQVPVVNMPFLSFVKIKVMMGNELPRHRLDAGLCYIFLIIKPH